jgi:hypothetical protein
MASMSTLQEHNREVLDAVRIRRDDLYEAILGLERALAVPAGDAPEVWASLLAGPLTHLGSVLDVHVRGTEGESGLFEQLREDAPWLLPAVQQLTSEHPGLVGAAQALTTRIEAVHTDGDVDDLRDTALDLMRQLLEHRHRGAELLYDAYQVDLSGTD